MGLLCINILGNKDACLLVVVVPIEWGGVGTCGPAYNTHQQHIRYNGWHIHPTA